MARWRALGLACVVGSLASAAAVAGGVELIRAMPVSGVAAVQPDHLDDPAPAAANTAPLDIPSPARCRSVAGTPVTFQPLTPASEFWAWQVLPEGSLYRSYLAGLREPRFGSQFIHERNQSFWDASLGGRVGIVRWGTLDPLWPEGWQIDLEGAAFPRLTLDENRDLVAADFRFGLPITLRRGRFEAKAAFYHLSSHLGDEYMLSHPGIDRINFSRDALVLGAAVYPLSNVRTYAEAGWAFYSDGGNEPWEFQFGVDCSPLRASGPAGDPFFAVNGHLRQEVDFGGAFTLQTGWQWRGSSGRLARLGFHYLNGQSEQYQFHREHEEQIGFGLWLDF